MKVVHAIQKGKSNKIIAYDLCICESTVKVHVRNIMTKLKAKNRTDVAMRAPTSLTMESPRPRQNPMALSHLGAGVASM